MLTSALMAAGGGMLGDMAAGATNAAIQYGTSKALAKYNYELG